MADQFVVARKRPSMANDRNVADGLYLAAETFWKGRWRRACRSVSAGDWTRDLCGQQSSDKTLFSLSLSTSNNRPQTRNLCWRERGEVAPCIYRAVCTYILINDMKNESKDSLRLIIDQEHEILSDSFFAARGRGASSSSSSRSRLRASLACVRSGRNNNYTGATLIWYANIGFIQPWSISGGIPSIPMRRYLNIETGYVYLYLCTHLRPCCCCCCIVWHLHRGDTGKRKRNMKCIE